MKQNLVKRYGFLVLGASIALNAFSGPVVVESRSATSDDYPFTTRTSGGDSEVVETNTTNISPTSVIPNGDSALSTTSGEMPGSNTTTSQTSNNTAINTGGGDAIQSVNTFNAMQQDIQELRGSVEELQYKLQQLEQQQKDRYINIDQRLRVLEGSSAPAAGLPISSDDTTTSPNGTSTNSAPSGNEKAEYDAAFNLMTKDKNFDKATKAFSEFVENYPMGFYTPNAWYWLGKLYSFDIKNLSKAKDAFEKVTQEFPTNAKASDALYELGVAYDKLGSKDQAKKSLKSVSSQYPGTGAALKAEQYLKEKSL